MMRDPLLFCLGLIIAVVLVLVAGTVAYAIIEDVPGAAPKADLLLPLPAPGGGQ